MAEENEKPTGQTRIARIVCAAQWFLLQPLFVMSLLLLAMIEALLSPFFWRFALSSIGTAIVAVGLLIARCDLQLQASGSWLAGIFQRISTLYGEQSPNCPVPEKPGPSWKM